MSVVDPALAAAVAAKLVARKQTLGVSESSAGGLISAALLAVPGASAFYIGGGIIYTGTAREGLLGVTPAMMTGIRSATIPMSRLLAATVRSKMGADWGLAETGATGPTGNRYGDAAGHCCLAVTGPKEMDRVLETGSPDRAANMVAFANAALALLGEALDAA
ncbi:CinA family protein [Acidisphaera sp. L21]|jgi:nicotinamide-nucleotide amidase|uniref:CinA family protein n=1 Tax=Acidisphaera sp. L21 TaxID=1641851 RepID=UPI00131E4135|nr:CinA family protein [Acidisphaera sp. L21]